MSSPIPLQSLRCVFQTFFFFTFSLLNCYDTGWISLIFALWTIMALVESAYWKLQNGSEGSSLLFFSWSKWVRNTADSYNNILPKLKIITPRFQIAFFYNSSYFPLKNAVRNGVVRTPFLNHLTLFLSMPLPIFPKFEKSVSSKYLKIDKLQFIFIFQFLWRAILAFI